MRTLWVTWAASALAILGVYLWAGWAAKRTLFGILIDNRGRYSLNRLQVTLWTLVVVSVTAGVFAARATVQGADPLGFSIPDALLGVAGISVGSAVLATAEKAYKNRTRTPFVAAAPPGQARFAQILLAEEGPSPDDTVDVTKLQNLLITVFLVAAYVVITVHTFAGWGPGTPVAGPADITTLPTFNATFLALLAISHAGYLTGKLPKRGEDPEQDVPDYSLAQKIKDRRDARVRGDILDPAAAAARRARQRAAHLQSVDMATGDGHVAAQAGNPPTGAGSQTRPGGSSAARMFWDRDQHR